MCHDATADAATEFGFPVITREIEIGGRIWQITAVEDQDRLIDDVRTDHDLECFPYGLLLWSSAIGLAQHLTGTPGLAAGQRVIELGCGVGLAGMAAASIGGHVTQTDHLPAALTLAAHNASRNGITDVELLLADWRQFPALPPFDLVIGSDVLYERAMHPSLRVLLPRLIRRDGAILFSDPIRPQALDFVQQMERDGWVVAMESRLVSWEAGRTEVAIFTARRSAD